MMGVALAVWRFNAQVEEAMHAIWIRRGATLGDLVTEAEKYKVELHVLLAPKIQPVPGDDDEPNRCPKCKGVLTVDEACSDRCFGCGLDLSPFTDEELERARKGK